MTLACEPFVVKAICYLITMCVLDCSWILAFIRCGLPLNKTVAYSAKLSGSSQRVLTTFVCFLFPVSIQWLPPQWWRFWPAFQAWRQEKWEAALLFIMHFGRSFTRFLQYMFVYLWAELWEDMCPWPSHVGDSVYWKLRWYSQRHQQPPVFLPSRSVVKHHTSLHHTSVPNNLTSKNDFFILTFQTRRWKRVYGGWKRTDLLHWEKLLPKQTRGRRSPNSQRSRRKSRLSEGRMLPCFCSEHWERFCTVNVSPGFLHKPFLSYVVCRFSTWVFSSFCLFEAIAVNTLY